MRQNSEEVQSTALVSAALANAVASWNALAEDAERAAKLGILHPSVAEVQARTYRNAARAIQHQIDTGVAVCSCHFKPIAKAA